MTELCFCAICHRKYLSEDLLVFDSKPVCLGCMVKHTRTCNQCGKHIWTKDALIHEGKALCTDCAGKSGESSRGSF